MIQKIKETKLVNEIQRKIKEIKHSKKSKHILDTLEQGIGISTDISKSKTSKIPEIDKKQENSTSLKEIKCQKLETADLLIKVLVPYLKSGQICDKPSFKVLAREFTHLVMKSQVSSSQIGNLVAKFFSVKSIIVTQDSAKHLVRNFANENQEMK